MQLSLVPELEKISGLKYSSLDRVETVLADIRYLRKLSKLIWESSRTKVDVAFYDLQERLARLAVLLRGECGVDKRDYHFYYKHFIEESYYVPSSTNYTHQDILDSVLKQKSTFAGAYIFSGSLWHPSTLSAYNDCIFYFNRLIRAIN